MKKLTVISILLICILAFGGCGNKELKTKVSKAGEENKSNLKFGEVEFENYGIKVYAPNGYEKEGSGVALKKIEDSTNYFLATSYPDISIEEYNEQAWSNWTKIKSEIKNFKDVEYSISQWELSGKPREGSLSEKYNCNKGISCCFVINNLLCTVEMLYKDNNFNYDDFIKVVEQIDTSNADVNFEFLNENEINNAYSAPDSYTGRMIKIKGKIFGSIGEQDNMIAFQMWGDAENNDKNTVVYGEKPSLVKLQEDDYVVVEGFVAGSWDGENGFGGNVSALQITPTKIKKSTYKDVMSPTEKLIKVNKTVKQYGYSITLQKVEISAIETRVYFKITNNGTDKFRLDNYDVELIQDGKQYDYTSNYDAHYEELQGELRPGTKGEGIVVFPRIDENTSFEIYCEGHSDNWDEDIKEVKFTINQ